MVKKSLLVTLASVLLYSMVLEILPDKLNTKQHLWNYNVIKAQQYLYETDDVSHRNVIVGSSLSARLVMDSLPSNYVNLAFGGQSLFDGLRIIERRSEKPQAVFIEMNSVLRGQNESFEETLFSPVSFYARKYIPSLRERNQPMGVLKGLLINLLGLDDQPVVVPDTEKTAEDLQPDIINPQAFAVKKETEAIAPTDEELHRAFDDLKCYVQALKQAGIQVVFFEMPIDTTLQRMARPQAVHTQFFAEFPLVDYTYITPPPRATYRTTDGVHLDALSASRFTAYLREEIELTVQ